MEQIPQMEVIKRKQNSSIMLDSVKREEHLTSANETEDHVFKVKKRRRKVESVFDLDFNQDSIKHFCKRC